MHVYIATSQHRISSESFARSPRFLPVARELEPVLSRCSVGRIRLFIPLSSDFHRLSLSLNRSKGASCRQALTAESFFHGVGEFSFRPRRINCARAPRENNFNWFGGPLVPRLQLSGSSGAGTRKT